MDPLAGERVEVVLDRVQDRQAPVVEERVEVGHGVERDPVEQQAAVGDADLDERRAAEVPVRVGPLDVDADDVLVDAPEGREDLGRVVDQDDRCVELPARGRGHADPSGEGRSGGCRGTQGPDVRVGREATVGRPRTCGPTRSHPVEHRPTLLCVHPHPDDEAIACGGVLAKAAGSGARTVVVTCTGGEEGENLAGIDLGDEDLVTHRRRELADALAALGVREHVYLGYRDSGMAGTAPNERPDSFHRADLDEAAVRLARIIRRVQPDVVVSDDEHGSYGHPDHIKAHQVTVRAVDLAADPDAPVDGAVWQVPKRYVHTLTESRLLAMHRGLLAAGLPSPFGDTEVAGADDLPFGSPDEVVTTVVDVAPYLPAKRAALVAHRSQIGEDSFFLNTPDDLAGVAFGTEEFVLEDGTPGVPDGEVEDDLFAGLTAVGPDPAADLPGVTSVGEGAAAPGLHPPVGTSGRADDPAHLDSSPSEARFRDVLGRFVTGVTVMTTDVAGRPHAMTASSVASVSVDPPLVLVCVDRDATMADEVVEAGAFALSFLAADQAELSLAFADPSRPNGPEQFDGIETHRARTGAPILAGAAGWVDATVWRIHDGGDHLIVVGEVTDLGHDDDVDPLVYHRGDYFHLGGSHG